MDYIGFIEKHFTPRVTEDKNGMCVTLTNTTEVMPECKVWFERAKKGWNKKPITGKNTYIIVESDTAPLLEFLNKYVGLTDDGQEYNMVRLSIIHYVMEVLDKHLTGE